MNGWVKLYRDLIIKPIWQESTPQQKTILITLLLMANHAENEWEFNNELYNIKPGQFITSLPNIVKNCGKGISTQNVRTALKRFEKYEFLTDESTNKNRLITILNWGVYQGDDDEVNKQPNRQLTGNQQATNRQLTANKNVKNIKNDKKVINIGQDEPDQTSKQPTFFRTIKIDGRDRVDPKDESHPFNVFWKEYPRRVKLMDAERSFKRNVKDWDTLKLIIVDIKERIAYGMWTEESKKYIPHPTTYLNNLQWEDEVDYSRYQKNNNQSSHNKFLDMLERGEFGE